MRYVLDSNVALKWVLPEADSDKALRLRIDFQSRIHESLAPDVFPVEIAHALAKAERRGIIPHGGADGLLANVLSTPPPIPSLSPLAQEGLGHRLSRTDQCTMTAFTSPRPSRSGANW